MFYSQLPSVSMYYLASMSIRLCHNNNSSTTIALVCCSFFNSRNYNILRMIRCNKYLRIKVHALSGHLTLNTQCIKK